MHIPAQKLGESVVINKVLHHGRSIVFRKSLFSKTIYLLCLQFINAPAKYFSSVRTTCGWTQWETELQQFIPYFPNVAYFASSLRIYVVALRLIMSAAYIRFPPYKCHGNYSQNFKSLRSSTSDGYTIFKPYNPCEFHYTAAGLTISFQDNQRSFPMILQVTCKLTLVVMENIKYIPLL